MAEIVHRTAHTNGVNLHVAEAGEGPPVILLHGFPELWYSWRHQLAALADAGFRAIAPDQRGYGHSDAPKRVEDYGARQLTADVTGLMDDIGAESAIVVGHDWGALVLWDLCRLHPERVRAAVPMSVPFFNPPVRPTEMFEMLSGGNFFYILYFQEVGPAEEELGQDPHRTMSRILWSASGGVERETAGLGSPLPREGTGFLDTMQAMPDPMPAWISPEDVKYYGDEFAHSGFFGPVSYYRNLDANWEITREIDPKVMDMPIYFIAGAKDPVLAVGDGVTMMKETLPDFRGATLIPGAGHWNQQEAPAETNAALIGFLKSL